MVTRIHLAPSGAPGGAPVPPPGIRRINLNRPLAVGAALVLWAAILIGLRLLAL